MTRDEVWFLDTSVLLTATDRSRSHHAAASHLLEESAAGRTRIAVNGQVFREYLVVATREADQNGLGLCASDALDNVAEFRRIALFLDETGRVSAALCELARTHGLTGKRIHDANIVATMGVHGVSILVTDNTSDFAGFPGITVRTLDAESV